MKEKIIHQEFFKIDKVLSDFPLYLENQKKWMKWCELNGYKYMFHTETNTEKYLINDKIKDFYKGLRNEWMRIDFMRYLILNQEGGLYVDLDICLNSEGEKHFNEYLSNRDEVYGLDKKNNFCNCMFGFSKGSLDNLIDFAIKQTEEKSKMPIYEIYKGRYLLYSTGSHMFRKWCKINKKKKCEILPKYLINSWTSSWLKSIVSKKTYKLHEINNKKIFLSSI